MRDDHASSAGHAVPQTGAAQSGAVQPGGTPETATQRGLTHSHAPQSAATRVTATQHGATRSDASRRGGTQPGGTQPGGTQPGGMQPGGMQPVTAQSGAARSGAARSGAARSGAARAGAGESGGTRRSRRPAGGAVAVLLGAAAWGSTGTAAHFAPAGASSASIGAARIALGGVVLLAIAVATTERRRAIRRLTAGGLASNGVLVLAVAAVGGYQVCFFTAVRLTGVAIGTVVAIGSAPVFTGVLSRLTGGARLSSRWMLATAAAVAGCTVLVTAGRAAGASADGVVLALAAGLCYAIYAVAAARLISGGHPETAVMGLLFGGAAVLLAPVLAATSPGWVLTARGLAVTVYLGVVTTVVAYLLYGRGLRTVTAPVAVTLGLAEPVVAAVLGLVVLGERLTLTADIGLVLVGLALASLVGAAPSASPPG